MTTNAVTASEKRAFRRIAHKLKPVVTVAENGLSESVLLELDRALNDHELVKIKILAESREKRAAIIEEMAVASKGTIIQRIGNICVLLRRSREPNPRLSNLLRHL